jgi:uncharacterized membrane protein YdbT with pleckstrin-like domain
MGMPISFTRYEVSDDRFITKAGFFTTETDEVLLYRILDIKLKRTFGQKLLGVGTITLYSADQTNSVIEVKNIKSPDKVRRFISRLVEDIRRELNLAGREIYGSSGHGGHEADIHVRSEYIDLDGDGIPD